MCPRPSSTNVTECAAISKVQLTQPLAALGPSDASLTTAVHLPCPPQSFGHSGCARSHPAPAYASPACGPTFGGTAVAVVGVFFPGGEQSGLAMAGGSAYRCRFGADEALALRKQTPAG